MGTWEFPGIHVAIFSHHNFDLIWEYMYFIDRGAGEN